MTLQKVPDSDVLAVAKIMKLSMSRDKTTDIITHFTTSRSELHADCTRNLKCNKTTGVHTSYYILYESKLNPVNKTNVNQH